MMPFTDDPVSNVLHYVLPPGLELHGATVFFSQFGEISSLELVPGDDLTIAIVFFDVRSVPTALSMLEGGQCWVMPKQGDFEVEVSGDIGLGLEDLETVSNVRTGDDDKFAVEFHDSRKAKQFRQSLGLECFTEEVSDLRENTRPPRPVPAYVKATSFVEESAEANLETVLVSCLPNYLASAGWMEVVLAQAELHVDATIKAWRDEYCGEALVHFAGNPYAAAQFVRYFNSCQQQGLSSSARARLVSSETAVEVSAQHLPDSGEATSTGEERNSTSSDSPPAVVKAVQKDPLFVRPRTRGWSAGSTTEGSTEAGTSDLGEEPSEEVVEAAEN